MSLAELKERVVELTREERLELAALISQLEYEANPDHQRELDRRLEAIEGGQKSSQEDLESLHRRLRLQGK